jgi:hypothetical protein
LEILAVNPSLFDGVHHTERPMQQRIWSKLCSTSTPSSACSTVGCSVSGLTAWLPSLRLSRRRCRRWPSIISPSRYTRRVTDQRLIMGYDEQIGTRLRLCRASRWPHAASTATVRSACSSCTTWPPRTNATLMRSAARPGGASHRLIPRSPWHDGTFGESSRWSASRSWGQLPSRCAWLSSA